MWYVVYNFLLTLVFFLALPFLPLILSLGPRYREGILQRLGMFPNRFPSSSDSARPVWIHASSVGEVRSAAPLVQELKARAPGQKVLLSTFTSTGNRMAKQVAGADAVIFLPFDLIWLVRRTLRKFNPSSLVVIETEIWPNLLREAFRRGMPTLLLSGRLSARALPRYALFRSFFRQVLGHFTAMGMQSREDAGRILKLGADERKVSVVGSLKFAAGQADSGGHHLRSVARGDRQWLVAGSTHHGEEEILLTVFASLRARYPKLSMILAPRHPERFGEVEKLLKNGQFDFHKRSQVDRDQLFEKEILLLDSVGELTDFYAMGDIAFVGGSLVDAGGHNALEPARWRKPILFGPFMVNFKHIADELKQTGAAVEVRGAEDLSREIAGLLSDAERSRRMGEKAAQVACGKNDALSGNLHLLARYL